MHASKPFGCQATSTLSVLLLCPFVITLILLLSPSTPLLQFFFSSPPCPSSFPISVFLHSVSNNILCYHLHRVLFFLFYVLSSSSTHCHYCLHYAIILTIFPHLTFPHSPPLFSSINLTKLLLDLHNFLPLIFSLSLSLSLSLSVFGITCRFNEPYIHGRQICRDASHLPR